MSNILKNMTRVIELTQQHFRCPDCDPEGSGYINGDRCKTCHATGYWACDTDFELQEALVTLRESLEVGNVSIESEETPSA
jgi:RecJ-like exonuclease